MKAKHLFLAGLGVMMLGACNSDDVVDLSGPDQIVEGEEGYVSFRINLPQVQNVSTRAESFNDGLAAEYEVKDATLLLFAGSEEATATFHSAYDLKTTGFAGSGTTEDQITSKATITQKITRPATGSNLYAMVVLNDNGLITISPEKGTIFAGTTLDNTKKLSWFTGTVFPEVTVQDAAKLTGNGIFMVNAPLASAQGGTVEPKDAKVQTLASVDQTKIYQTAAEAGNNPAAVIYVERAVAKVTVTQNSSLADSSNPNVAGYTIKNWILDNTNTKTYPVRNMTNVSNWFGYTSTKLTSADYRFVGGSVVGNDINNKPCYRTYFAIDPNFNTFTEGELNTIGGQTFTEAKVTALEIGSDKPGYCLENVFDIANQRERSTTRVIVAAQLNIKNQTAGADFYIFNDNTSTVYTFDGVQKEVKRIALNWLEEYKTEWLEPKAPAKEYTIDENDLAVSVPNGTEGGYIQDKLTLTLTLPEEAQMKEGKELTDLQKSMAAEVANKLSIAYYKGGIAYYPVLVKHFGDTQTPWTYTAGMAESYPDPNAAQNWLGRYGVLRNNWYQINVTGVKNIGSPEVPTVTDKFDDPVDSYMSVEINILSWAVRTQDVEL